MATVVGLHGAQGSRDVTFEPGFSFPETQLLIHEVEAAKPGLSSKVETCLNFAKITGRKATVGPLYTRRRVA